MRVPESYIVVVTMGSHASWYQTLSSEKRAAIKRLHKLETRSNLVAVAFVCAWWALAWAAVSVENVFARIPAYLVIAILLSSIANFMHEAAHGNVFRNRQADRLWGIVMGLPILISFSAYQHSHQAHHRHNRTEKDPDEFFNITSNRTLLSVLSVIWTFVGTFVYLLYLPGVALVQGSARVRRAVALEYGLIVVFWTALWLAAVNAGVSAWLVHGWLIPVLCGSLWINMRYWAEHMLTDRGHPLRETRTVLSSKLFSFMNVHMNYHLDHHLFPGVPWYNLPRLHSLLEDEFRAAGSSIYRSYLRYFFDAFRKGIHGRAMGFHPAEESMITTAGRGARATDSR